MQSTWATICKELLQLRRDKAGLAVLFVMPAFLVLIITLVQDNVLNSTGKDVKAILINSDSGEVGKTIESWLSEEGEFTLTTSLDGEPITKDIAIDLVHDGTFQFCVIIPEDCTATMRERTASLAENSLSTNRGAVSQTDSATAVTLTVFFDPTVQGSFRTAVTTSLEHMMLALEVDEKIQAVSDLLPERVTTLIKQGLLAEIDDNIPAAIRDDIVGGIPDLQFHWNSDSILALDQETLVAPTAVQQNVPAWTLFGMFFIVVPLGGALLRERDEGTLTRLLAMPVSTLSILLGKIIAYVCVCMGQFAAMLLVGRFVLPLFGTPELELGSSPAALLVMALCSALAATGFGILVGSLAHSYEQASTIGPVAIVIMAAIGGIMVPVYVMPQIMKQLSIISPLAWGLNGFLDIFIRDGRVVTILPWAGCLLLFFAVCLGTSWLVFRNRQALR